MRSPDQTPIISGRRVLVRSPNWLGDAVMALPALRAVRRAVGAGTLAVAAPQPLLPLYRLLPEVDEVIGLHQSSRRGRRQDADALRAGAFDAGILFTNSFGSALTLQRAGIPERWGYRADLRGILLSRAVWKPRGRRHHSDYYRELVARLGIPAEAFDAPIDVPQALRETARRLLESRGRSPGSLLVGLAPGTGHGAAKQWPAERMGALIRELRTARPEVQCVLVGSREDRPVGRAIESAVGAAAAPGSATPATESRLVNLMGETGIGELAGVLAECRTVVASDAGAMHLAAAVGTPVVAIFGPSDERVTAPLGPHQVLAADVWCRPCLLRDCPIDHRCMKRITVERVLHAVLGRLTPGAAP